MKGSGSSLFPVKHCWMRKTNMATVSRLGRGFLWSGIGVKIKVAFHCTGLVFYAVLFEFNVASVAFSWSVAN